MVLGYLSLMDTYVPKGMVSLTWCYVAVMMSLSWESLRWPLLVCGDNSASLNCRALIYVVADVQTVVTVVTTVTVP